MLKLAEARVTFPFLLRCWWSITAAPHRCSTPSLQHPVSASSSPAKAELRLGERGEIGAGAGGWSRTASRLGGKPCSHRGFRLPCKYPDHAGVWQWWQENCWRVQEKRSRGWKSLGVSFL